MAGDLALENIEEFLFDEDRVVSYKWLSKTLSMHVNQAKSKLEQFAESWREKPGSKPITLTFFVSGIQETTSGNELTKVAIVKEEDLENVKKNLKKTLCEHIYSIQKTALKDTAVLYQTDFDETKQHLSECNKFSAIKCKSAQTRSGYSLGPVVNSVPNGRSSPVEETQEKVAPSKGTAAPEKKKGLAAFMNKQKMQEKNETKPTKISPVSEKKTNSTAKKGSLMHAFQSSKKTSPKSQTVAKEESSTSKVEKESKKEESLKEDKKEIEKGKEKVVSPAKEEAGKNSETVAHKEEKNDKSEKKKEVVSRKSSKRDMSDSDSESESKAKRSKGTKRRRVIQEESSSEEEESDHEMLEEEEEEEMDDTPIPPTPEVKSKDSQKEESESLPTQEENTEGRKKGRKKVWKKKRYLDDEGCMVTEKVFDYESGEESNDEKETEESAEKTSPSGKKDQSPSGQSSASSSSADKNSKKESPPSSGRKQTALTSFFKKR